MHYRFKAPAKINRFLRITHQRPDGYHALQTVFQFLTLSDTLHFTITDQGGVSYLNAEQLPLKSEQNLITRAIRAIEKVCDITLNIQITLEKRIPMGAGLGGGSSNAATTLYALNQMYHLGLTKGELLSIGATLGADVPIFLYAHAAWAEGRGDQFTQLSPPEEPLLLIIPPLQVSTERIFSAPNLSRKNPPLSMAQLKEIPFSLNDCLMTTIDAYPLMGKYLNALKLIDIEVAMTGTGSTLFLRPGNLSQQQTEELKQLACEYQWKLIKTNAVNISPLLT